MRTFAPLVLLCALCVACGEHVRAGAPAQDATLSPPAAPPTAGDAAAAAAAPQLSLVADLSTEDATWSAVLFSDLDAEIGARADGVVRSVAVDLGDRVREGDVLLVLDDAGERARVAAAAAAHELARVEFQRTEELLQKEFVTRAQLDEATFRLRSAEAALRVAEIDLEHTRVVAPFSGVITRRMTGRGRAVREGEPLFRLTALEPLRALVRLPERDARALVPGVKADLLAEDGARIPAVVQRISPATDAQSGTVEVLLEVRHPGPLRPGSSATIVLHPVDPRR